MKSTRRGFPGRVAAIAAAVAVAPAVKAEAAVPEAPVQTIDPSSDTGTFTVTAGGVEHLAVNGVKIPFWA
jgi:hypothetical protein